MEVIKGDIISALLNGDIGILAHGCNCSNGFGSGLAGQIARRLPEAKEVFHETRKSCEDSLGEVVMVTNLSIGWGSAVANCYTQENYGRDPDIEYVSYDAIKLCMERLARYSADHNQTVGLPKIGCGLAGGDWEIVKPIIKNSFKKHNAKYKIYILKGEA